MQLGQFCFHDEAHGIGEAPSAKEILGGGPGFLGEGDIAAASGVPGGRGDAAKCDGQIEFRGDEREPEGVIPLLDEQALTLELLNAVGSEFPASAFIRNHWAIMRGTEAD